MEDRKLVESLLAVAGIWLVARDVPDFLTMAFLTTSSQLPLETNGVNLFTVQIAQLLTSVATGAVLMFARRPLARWIHPGDSLTQLTAEPILAAGTAIVGTYFFMAGLRSVAPLLFHHARVSADPYAVWRGAISLSLGLALFASTRWIVHAWHSILLGKRGAT